MPRSASVVAHLVLDRAEVLADHEGAGPLALEREDVEQVVGRVADVGAVGAARRRAGSRTGGTGP